MKTATVTLLAMLAAAVMPAIHAGPAAAAEDCSQWLYLSNQMDQSANALFRQGDNKQADSHWAESRRLYDRYKACMDTRARAKGPSPAEAEAQAKIEAARAKIEAARAKAEAERVKAAAEARARMSPEERAKDDEAAWDAAHSTGITIVIELETDYDPFSDDPPGSTSMPSSSPAPAASPSAGAGHSGSGGHAK